MRTAGIAYVGGFRTLVSTKIRLLRLEKPERQMVGGKVLEHRAIDSHGSLDTGEICLGAYKAFRNSAF